MHADEFVERVADANPGVDDDTVAAIVTGVEKHMCGMLAMHNVGQRPGRASVKDQCQNIVLQARSRVRWQSSGCLGMTPSRQRSACFSWAAAGGSSSSPGSRRATGCTTAGQSDQMAPSLTRCNRYLIMRGSPTHCSTSRGEVRSSEVLDVTLNRQHQCQCQHHACGYMFVKLIISFLISSVF